MEDITFEQMFEWLEAQRRSQDPRGSGNKIIDALQTEIGYHTNNEEILVDDSDTIKEDTYEI